MFVHPYIPNSRRKDRDGVTPKRDHLSLWSPRHSWERVNEHISDPEGLWLKNNEPSIGHRIVMDMSSKCFEMASFAKRLQT